MKRLLIVVLALGLIVPLCARPAEAQVIDVLSYVFPNPPYGNALSVITQLGNPWRTYSTGGYVWGERLPGFFITKGNAEYLPDGRVLIYNFEEMVYDSEWIYLVRDTSWTSHCQDNGHVVGQLLFVYENGQWLRGGRHFPRWIQPGYPVSTGQKYVQGVERKDGPNDNSVQEGRWCTADYSGWTESTVAGELIGGQTVGGKYFSDVLQLRIVGGSGNGDIWWFAKGYGLIRFTDGSITEYHSSIANPYEVQVRIPCSPNAPCM